MLASAYIRTQEEGIKASRAETHTHRPPSAAAGEVIKHLAVHEIASRCTTLLPVSPGEGERLIQSVKLIHSGSASPYASSLFKSPNDSGICAHLPHTDLHYCNHISLTQSLTVIHHPSSCFLALSLSLLNHSLGCSWRRSACVSDKKQCATLRRTHAHTKGHSLILPNLVHKRQQTRPASSKRGARSTRHSAVAAAKAFVRMRYEFSSGFDA